MTYCRFCGNEVHPAAEICVSCGCRPSTGHQYCGKCGTKTHEDQEVCLECGALLTRRVVQSGQPAGFWIRATAYFIDGIILGAIGFVLYLLLLLAAVFIGLTLGDQSEFAVMILVFLYFLGVIGAQASYFIIMNASKHQGTLGKMAVGIKVVDLNGNRITAKKSALRYLGYLLSWMTLYVGFILAAFTENKQALHDMIANTLVVQK